MIKIIIKITISLILFISTIVNAQDFQGKAIYQTKRNFNLKIDSSKVDNSQQNAIQEMLRKQFEKTYILAFDKTTSLYKEETKLDKPQPSQSIMTIKMETNSDVLYKNISEKTYTKSQETFGKKFLIKDKLKPLDWKIEKETKSIGKYLCIKATATVLVDDYDKEYNKKDKQKELKITAWYTPEIPINNGPADYFGLPGLILELHKGKMHYVCTKIIMNAKEKIVITAPKKGKEINQKDFDKMMAKKSKEMMEQYKGGRKKEKSNRHVISIQG